MKKGLTLVGFLGVAYTVLVAIGYTKGFGAVVPPILPIAPERYYLFLSFATIPIFYLLAFSFSYTAIGLGLLMRVTIKLGDMLDTYAVAVVPPVFLLMFIPECILITFFPHLRLHPLGGFGVIPEWVDIIRQTLAFLWPFSFFVRHFVKQYELSIFKAVGITTTCFTVYVGLSLLLVR